MTLLAAVEETVAALDPAKVDAAWVELARRYAREIDGADALARAAAETIARLKREDEPDAWELIDALRAQLSARTALATHGRLLHALLKDSTAVRAARPAAGASAGGAKASSPLAKLRSVQ